jgi:hypothetical protein
LRAAATFANTMTMNPLNLTAKALKLNAPSSSIPRGSPVSPWPESPRVPFEVVVGGRRVRGELNPKTLRRVVTAVVAGQRRTVILRGRLDGDTLLDAGISAVSVG